MKPTAIIILTWNGYDLTTACVQGFLQHNVPADIYILDNGSVYDEAKKLRHNFGETITVQRSEKNLGFSGGNNYWLRQLQTDYPYIVLLNQDTVVNGDFITPLIQAMDNDANIAACGPTGGAISLWTGKVRRDSGTDCIIGYCLALRSAVLTKVGLLEEQYFAYYEEADWCWRARQAGYHCQVVSNLPVTHLQNHTFRTQYIARNMVWFMKRFASPVQLIFFFCYYFTVFWIERLRKGARLHELYQAAWAGWFKHLPRL